MIDVSIVIVCMNNLNNLYPCLNSIKEQTTHTTYETFVVAYLFNEDNLKKVKADFPWVFFIESNQIRGFAENNNMALRQAKGKYCFVLNDDTEMKEPVVDKLFETIEGLPDDVASISPRSVFGNGMLQSCGRPKHTLWTYTKSSLQLWHEQKQKSKYVNQEGVFQTYDLWGAFFMIRTDVFKKMGWLDERYFFSPEDLALSHKLNQNGYRCFATSEVTIIHYEGMTGRGTSKLQVATMPAALKGRIIFYSEESHLSRFLVSILFFLLQLPPLFFHSFMALANKNKERNTILIKGCVNNMKVCFSSLTPKDIFIKYSKPFFNKSIN